MSCPPKVDWPLTPMARMVSWAPLWLSTGLPDTQTICQ